MQSNSAAPSASSAPAGRGGPAPRGGTSPIPAPNIPEGAQAMRRLLLPLPSWHLLHQRRAAGEGDVRVRVNGAVCWKTIHLRAAQGCAHAPPKFPCTLEIRFGEVSPGKGCHLLSQIDLNINFSSFSRLLNIKESLVTRMGENITESVVRWV